MGAPPLPRSLQDETPWSVYDEFVRRAMRDGALAAGHHNRNFVVPLTEAMADLVGAEPGAPVIVRMRKPDALPVVIRTWRNEGEVLDAIEGTLPHAPRSVVRTETLAVHSYVEGVPLAAVSPNEKPIDRMLIRALAGLLAEMTRVRRDALPPLPSMWPADGKDSQGFLRALVHLADEQIRRPNWAAFGGLFAALGVPEDALVRFGERVPLMSRRPYSLLHTDLHRDNLILSYGGSPPLICVDWELATYGDPLHDLATHLVRMHYPHHQWDEVVDAWAEAMLAVRPRATVGMAKDLRHYVAFERAQSVYPDVMRAAAALAGTDDERSLDEATCAVHRALLAASEPLRLSYVPETDEIKKTLYRWRAARGGGRGGSGSAGVSWVLDSRVPEYPRFPLSVVQHALAAEAAAPAARVYKGITHLNSVVQVPQVDFPVVVRRRMRWSKERQFLSEHAVLRAIEQSGVWVRTPAVLALGESGNGDPFAIHTYVGPRDIDRPPTHPVHGLLPHEADSLVHQLAELTRVDYRQIDPAAGEGRFYTWLGEQLVMLVSELPKESQQLARRLGLPDALRLHQLLSRHPVSFRQPALLHGDLNPWNLVRGEGRFAELTIIDWEMAVVGDPLYDLVRHMHLTPTRPEIRDRMFSTWERLLAPEFTHDWRRDWRVYRWIEMARSAYVDLDRMVTREGADAPNVRRAVGSYAHTLEEANAALGMPTRPTANPYLSRALPRREAERWEKGSRPAGL